MNNITQIDNFFSITATEVVCCLSLSLERLADRLQCVPISWVEGPFNMLGFSLSTPHGMILSVFRSAHAETGKILDVSIYTEKECLEAFGGGGALVEIMEAFRLQARDISYIPSEFLGNGSPSSDLLDEEAENFTRLLLVAHDTGKIEPGMPKPS